MVYNSQEPGSSGIAAGISQLVSGCPYAHKVTELTSKTTDWGRNTLYYLLFGSAECFREQMRIEPGIDRFFPEKEFPVGHKIKLRVVTDPSKIEKILKIARYSEIMTGGSEFDALAHVIGDKNPLTEITEAEHDKIKQYAMKTRFGANIINQNALKYFTFAKNFVKKEFSLADGNTLFNMTEILPCFTLGISSNIVFESENTFSDSKITSVIGKLEQFISEGMLGHVRHFVPGCLDHEKTKCMQTFDQVVKQIQYPEKQNNGFACTMKRDNFSDEQIASMIKTVLVVGSGTTKSTLISAIYELQKNPEYQEKLYQALVALDIPEFNEEELSDQSAEAYRKQIVDKLFKCEELKHFLLEVMRIHSPIPIQGRKTVTPIIIDDLIIPAGTTIYLTNFLANRDEANWENPSVFDPSRFENAENIKRFSPFSVGKNECMGRFHARITMMCFLYHFLMGYKIPPFDYGIDEVRMGDFFTHAFLRAIQAFLQLRKKMGN